MHSRQTRFVAGTQQLLVIGAVFAALVPAANVVSLDVVRDHPRPGAVSAPAASSAASALAAYETVADRAAEVPTEATDAQVREIALTAPAKGARPALARASGTGATAAVYRAGAGQVQATTVADAATGTTTIVSEPTDVEGFGTVGVTWAHGENLTEDDIALQVRTRTDGTWSAWEELGYHDDHGPDAGTPEAEGTRAGTDEALVGHVDQVQIRAEVTTAKLPDDMTLAVIDPGTPSSTAKQTPKIDTNDLPTIPDAVPNADGELVDSSAGADGTGAAAPASTTASAMAGAGLSLVAASSDPEADGTDTEAASGSIDDGLALAATSVAKPTIYSRAQWGANEKIREQTAPSYGTIHGGFVHHTVNANDYTAAEVPGIIRSIYTYHVKSRGWRDLGYNFLVDRFGRIWEGRAGGVARPVVGAHTEGYNGDSFAMSAIGNFETVKPSQEVVGAYAALFAWKLSLHGISASATSAKINGRTFSSPIMGHRDTKSTACPGKYLYARMSDIRRATSALQKGWNFAARDANLVGSAHPDIIARRASDKRGVIIPTTGQSGFAGTVTTRVAKSNFVLSGDLTGDGRADVVAWNASGVLAIRPGNGKGGFTKAKFKAKRVVKRNLVVAVGDINGDKRNDLIARHSRTGRLATLLGNGKGGFTSGTPDKRSFAAFNWIDAGDVNGDGKVDLLARTGDGKIYWMAGTGRGTFGTSRVLSTGWKSATSLSVADFNFDGKADIVYRAKGKKGYVRLGTGSGFTGNLGPYGGFSGAITLAGATQVTGGASPEVLAVAAGQLILMKKYDATDLGAPVVTNLNLAKANLVLNAGDWNRDGKGDVIYRNTDGRLYLTLGNGGGTFTGAHLLGNFAGYSLISAVGDMTGDGYGDLMAQNSTGMRIFPGNGKTGVNSSYAVYGRISGTAQLPGGTWDADKAPDVLVRNGNSLVMYRGNGPGGLSSPRIVATGMNGYDWVIGVGALNGSGHSDLVVRDSAGTLYSMRGQSNGSLSARRVLGYGFKGYDLAG